MEATKPLKTIRSFVRREGRLTPGQAKALDELWSIYGIDLPEGDKLLDLDLCFAKTQPIVLEIGFGNGKSLLEMAQASPDKNFIGIEVHRPGVGALLRDIELAGIKNLRVMSEDANDILKKHIANETLQTVQLFFPDPWPKKKHHKRRIVQPAWLSLIASKLRSGGTLHMATDWEEYAIHMLEVTDQCEQFENTSGAGTYTPRPEFRPLTKFENRGTKLGHGVWDLIYRKN